MLMLGSTRHLARTLYLPMLLIGTLAAGCGGGGDNSVSPASLKSQLLPASQLPPLKLERTFQWDNPTDFIVQGTVLPAQTAPSDAIAEMSGFQAAAGDSLVPPGDSPPVPVDVAAFDSSDNAKAAQTYLHGQDLQQPCINKCSVNPKELPIKGIPGVTAVHQVPINRNAKDGFEAYAAEFTIGSNLFYVYAKGGPGDISPTRFENGVGRVYKYASQHSQ